jgi:glycosyltransferase involved in cell wall biosynthesis
VGNLEPYQGVDLLLEAMPIARQKVQDFDLIIAGGTDASIAAYRAKAQSLGVANCTHFIGRWPSDRLAELLAEADILTAPRIRGINTPMKIFPYMHSGKPLLATDLRTHNQILDDSLAMLAPADPLGFAQGMVRLLQNPSLRQKLGAAGREYVKRNHTYDAHAKRVNQLYDFVKEACGPSAPSVNAESPA